MGNRGDLKTFSGFQKGVTMRTDTANEYIQFANTSDRPIIPLWNAMINYINAFYRYQSEQIITRKKIIEKMRSFGYNINKFSIDTYRNYLYKAGYLSYVIRPNGKKWLGKYKILHEIPSDLSVDDCRREAYGPKIDWEMADNTEYGSTMIMKVPKNRRKGVLSEDKFHTQFHPNKTIHRPKEFLTQEDMEIK